MKSVKITKHILLIGLIVLFLWVCPLFAEDDGDECIDPIQAAESEILGRLNLARNNPWAEAERLGLDPEVLRADVVPEEVAAQWDQGLWPLVHNDILHEVARAYCEDMIEHGFFSHVTPEGLTPEDRVIIAGYDANIVREELGALSFNTYLDPSEAAQALMDVLLRDSLIQRETEEGPTLLNERVVEVGIALLGGELTTCEEQAHAYVLCILLVRPDGPSAETWLQCGRLYNDSNCNCIYDVGEGLPEMEMAIRNGEILAVTDAKGRYCIQRPLGRWVLQVDDRVLPHTARLDDVIVDDGVLYRDYNYRTFREDW
ncbi:MAG: CAP domain-containing protein [Deltaproteobacteria bacterium]|nr:CAP domain-containing protein [Deltaproteobacteria bacterium]